MENSKGGSFSIYNTPPVGKQKLALQDLINAINHEFARLNIGAEVLILTDASKPLQFYIKIRVTDEREYFEVLIDPELAAILGFRDFDFPKGEHIGGYSFDFDEFANMPIGCE